MDKLQPCVPRPVDDLAKRLKRLKGGENISDRFDLSDPAAPVLILRCRCCEVEHRVPCEAGIPPVAIGLMSVWCCEQCADKERAAEEEHRRQLELDRRAHEAGIPEQWRAVKFEDMIESGRRSKAIDGARQWAETEHPHGLLLFGPVGTGKSRLAATAAWKRIERWPVRWVSMAELIQLLTAAYSDKDRADALKLLAGTGPLVLDDLDKINPSEVVKSQLFVALEKRMAAGTPLLLTTNLDPARLKEKFGEAIVSRILGYCLTRVYELDGPDRRLSMDVAA